MKKTIYIKKKHIKNGKPEICTSCPIALSIRETFNIRACDVDVDMGGIRIKDKYYDVPHKAFLFIERFDGGKAVKCFKFKLEEID